MRLEGFVPKAWGSELIWATNDLYCGKLMNFDAGSSFSMHLHREKDETWYVLSGKFILKTINTIDASVSERPLTVGDVWRNLPMKPHQLCCVEQGTIIEVSTPDSVEDNYRVGKGSGQQ